MAGPRPCPPQQNSSLGMCSLGAVGGALSTHPPARLPARARLPCPGFQGRVPDGPTSQSHEGLHQVGSHILRRLLYRTPDDAHIVKRIDLFDTPHERALAGGEASGVGPTAAAPGGVPARGRCERVLHAAEAGGGIRARRHSIHFQRWVGSGRMTLGHFQHRVASRGVPTWPPSTRPPAWPPVTPPPSRAPRPTWA
jgi:hypothetical protein